MHLKGGSNRSSTFSVPSPENILYINEILFIRPSIDNLQTPFNPLAPELFFFKF